MKHIKVCTPILLTVMLIVSISGCASSLSGSKAAHAVDLMKNISPGTVDVKPIDDGFIENMADLSIELFKRSGANGENSLISPLSVILALTMTANGADGETLTQMETMLGGDISISDMNDYLHTFVNSLMSTEKTRLNIANSIWFRDDEDNLKVEPDFLKLNADYYGAAAFKAAFDDQSVKDINNWVETSTDGMIDEILVEIDPLSMLFIINAIVFDAYWADVYNEDQVGKGDFTNIQGIVQNVDYLHSSESIYLDDGMATGFRKFYSGHGYSFIALLPNEGISVSSYVESLTGTGFLEMLENSRGVLVHASMPKFEFENNINMNDVLIDLGIPDAFYDCTADFSKMATCTLGNLYISKVIHKTFISVDELGTKAGAATLVDMQCESAPDEFEIVDLDRPFVFAIVDARNIPIFIGTLLTV